MKPLCKLSLAVALGLAAYGAAAAAADAPKTQFAGFTAFAGSESNLQSLVGGLRNDKPITLTSTASGTTRTVTFDPPTKPMGFGNVRHALTLARAELADAGISNPTPQQIQAAMMGGSVTAADGSTVQLKGVLQLRSQGMGWGRIRQALNLPPATFAASPHAGAGITSALGPAHSAAAHAERDDAGVEAHGEAGGRAAATMPPSHAGVVTAAGASASSAFNPGRGGGLGRGAH